jgi:hypothetical protein
MIDLLGYIATGMTLYSFVVQDQVKLRVINSCGAVMWVIYGGFIDSSPVIITNLLIIVLNIRWLYLNWWQKLTRD